MNVQETLIREPFSSVMAYFLVKEALSLRSTVKHFQLAEWCDFSPLCSQFIPNSLCTSKLSMSVLLMVIIIIVVVVVIFLMHLVLLNDIPNCLAVEVKTK